MSHHYGPFHFWRISRLIKHGPITETLNWNCVPGVFVFSPNPNNVTVMFPSGAGVELRLIEGTVTTTVLLPEDFHGATLGMLGKMNGDPADDLTTPDGQTVSIQSTPQELFEFGSHCERLLEVYFR